MIGAVVAVVLALVVFTLVFVPKSKPSPRPAPIVMAPRSAQVQITKDGFVPAITKVKPGTIVTWVNTDSSLHQVAADPYPSRSSLPGLYSIALTKDGTYSYTFTNSGQFTYQDYLNPLKFHGTVEVGE